MIIKKLKIDGAFEFCFKQHLDNRGSFFRIFCKKELKKKGINFSPLQQSICLNKKKWTLRGLHWQSHKDAEQKIVQVINGKIFDVIVDMRKNSKTYLQWDKVILSDRKKNAVFVPKNCAHGYITLKNNSNLLYIIDNYFNGKTKRISYNDKNLKIKWPKFQKLIISKQDRK
jgi:dTDP-4-dehydrorhamnose 3,5-epimerase